MKSLRGMAAMLAGVALIGLTACGGGDDGDDDVASSNTTQAVSQTTQASNDDEGGEAQPSPCLSNEEIAAIAGKPPETTDHRENHVKKWPNGGCTYEWTSLGVSLRITMEYRSDTAEYFATLNERSKDDEYKETMTPPALGDEAFLTRSTGRSDKAGINGIMRVRRGPLLMGSNYTDYDNKLRPSLQDSVALWTEFMRAHLNKLPAAQP